MMLDRYQVAMQTAARGAALLGLGIAMAAGADSARPAAAPVTAPENRPAMAAWISSGGPRHVWLEIYGDEFPAEKIAQDARTQGLTDALFFVQGGRGGPVQYPTKHPLLKADPYMKGRDYTEEMLAACDQADIRVWLAFTPPPSNETFPGTDIQGLNDPRMIKLYCDMVDEIAALYGHHQSLAGFLPHEVNCAEGPDKHADDRAEFSKFCEAEFGEPFQGEVWPPMENAGDLNWRRYFLYRIHVVTAFTEAAAKTAAKHNLKTMFCLYPPVAHTSPSWKWGYDPVQLAAVCENTWVPMVRESNKFYQNLRGIYLDLGLSYRGMNRAGSYAYAFHGYPLAYFEFRIPNYVAGVREFYRKINERRTKQPSSYDFYLAHCGVTAREIELFFGQTMVTRWLGLAAAWQGGSSPARVAVATASTPFIMQHPASPGTAYTPRVAELMESLTEYTDVDGLLLDTPWALDAANLRQYKLIIIPEDMGAGLSAGMAQSLQAYLKGGGRLLVIASPLYQSRADLTQPADLTAALCGARIDKTEAGGFIMPEGPGYPAGMKKFWADRLLRVTPAGGSVEVKDAITGRPLLIRHGNAALAALSYSRDALPFFKATVANLAQPPVRLESNPDVKAPRLRLLESVFKNQTLCLSFFNQGNAVLRIDAADAGLAGDNFEVKNILNGVILHAGDAASLAAGVPLAIKHPNQPLVLAVGAPDRLAAFQGIVPPGEEFAGLAEFTGAENPEVPVDVPDKPGIKVGIYHSGFAAQVLAEALNRAPDMNAFILPRMDADALGKCDVFILPQSTAIGYIKLGIPGLTNWVANGGGALLLHTAAGIKLDGPVFPGVGAAGAKVPFDVSPREHRVRPAAPHPAAAGLTTNDWFAPAFQYDHLVINPGPDGTAVIVDDEGAPVLAAGAVGQGRVALNGMLPGAAGARDDGSGKILQAPAGAEWEVFLNTVRWLAGDKQPADKP